MINASVKLLTFFWIVIVPKIGEVILWVRGRMTIGLSLRRTRHRSEHYSTK